MERIAKIADSGAGLKTVLIGQERDKGDTNRLPPELGAKIQKLSVETLNKLNRVWSYDLSVITEKLISKGEPIQTKSEQLHLLESLLGKDVSGEFAGKIEVEFRRFMTIALVNKVSNVGPSRVIDMYWHLFMLHTTEYEKFCDEIFGKFVGHAPVTKETRQDVRSSYEGTLESYRSLFGEPDAAMWPGLEKRAGDCVPTYKCKPSCDSCNSE